MRILSLAALGVSTLALTGCSFFNGHGNSNSHQTYGGHNGGSYNAPATCNSASGAANCQYGAALSKWNLESNIGGEYITGGEAITAVSRADPLNSAEINELDMKDAYDEGRRVELGGSYALNPNQKITAMVNYSHAEGNTRNLGQIDGFDVAGKLSDYKGVGVEAGFRQYFNPQRVGQNFGYRPYVEGRLGANNIDDVKVTYVTDRPVATTQTTALYEGGWVPTVAALAGVETPFFNRGTIGLETGLRYAGALDREASAVNSEFISANKASDRWSVPLTIRGRYRF